MLLGQINTYNFDAREPATFSIEAYSASANYIIDIEFYERNKYGSVAWSTQIMNELNFTIPADTLENNTDYNVRARLNNGIWTSMQSFHCRKKGIITLPDLSQIDESEFSLTFDWEQSENVLPKSIVAWMEIEGEVYQKQTKYIENTVPTLGGVIIIKDSILTLPVDQTYTLSVEKSYQDPIEISFKLESSDTAQSVAFKIANQLKLQARLDILLFDTKIITSTKESVYKIDYIPESVIASHIDAESLLFEMPLYTFRIEPDTISSGEMKAQIVTQYDMSCEASTPFAFTASTDDKIAGYVKAGKLPSAGANLIILDIAEDLNLPKSVTTEIMPSIAAIRLRRKELPNISEYFLARRTKLESEVSDPIQRELLESLFTRYKEEKFRTKPFWQTVAYLDKSVIDDFSHISFVDKLIDNGGNYIYNIEFILTSGQVVSLRQHDHEGVTDLPEGFKSDDVTYYNDYIEILNCEFDADFLTDANQNFRIDFDRLYNQFIRNSGIQPQPLLNSKYPAIVRGEQDYYSGTISFRVLANKTVLEYKINNREQMVLTESLINFLVNGKKKLFRTKSGFSIIMQVVQSPSIEPNEVIDGLPVISFEFVQTDSVLNIEDFIWKGVV